MGFFVITALQGLWVNLIIDYEPGRGGFVPYVSHRRVDGACSRCAC